MCGFIFGTLCLMALAKLSFGGRRGRCGRGGCGKGHCGHDRHRGHGDHGPWGGWGPGAHPRERWMLRMLFERLDTTPGQEKVMIAAFEAHREALRNAWQSVRASREDLARAVRGEVFDEAAIVTAQQSHQQSMHALHEVITDSLRKVHEALDGHQRETLAELIAEGPWGFRGGRGGRGGPFGHHGPRGPYRG